MVEIQSGKHYKFTNCKNTGVVLEVSGVDNRSIIGYDWCWGDNQKWELIRTQNGWNIKNVGADLYLAVDGDRNAQNSYSNGTKVVGAQQAYEWHLPEINGSCRVSVPDVNKCLDLSNHGAGPDVEIWGFWESLNQFWVIELV